MKWRSLTIFENPWGFSFDDRWRCKMTMVDDPWRSPWRSWKMSKVTGVLAVLVLKESIIGKFPKSRILGKFEKKGFHETKIAIFCVFKCDLIYEIQILVSEHVFPQLFIFCLTTWLFFEIQLYFAELFGNDWIFFSIFISAAKYFGMLEKSVVDFGFCLILPVREINSENNKFSVG